MATPLNAAALSIGVELEKVQAIPFGPNSSRTTPFCTPWCLTAPMSWMFLRPSCPHSYPRLPRLAVLADHR